jgi:mono/diheme cytochrome c family protein
MGYSVQYRGTEKEFHMRFRIAVLLVISGAVVAALSAQSSSSIKKVPLSPTSPVSGKQMFETYCAVCHGPEGKGNGPAAKALKSVPTDLTRLSAQNQGKYPEMRVTNTLVRPDVAAHGSHEMPIWGDLFRSLGNGTNDMVTLRVVNLTSYAKSLQAQ